MVETASLLTRERASAGPVHRFAQAVDLLALHRRDPVRYPHLLASAASGTPQGRFDILFAFPGESLTLGPWGLVGPLGVPTASGQFLDALDGWWRRVGPALPPADVPYVPFFGGWFLALGYELAGEIEPTLRLPRAETALPTAVATRFRTALVFDHATRETVLVGEEGTEHLIELMVRDLSALAGEPGIPAVRPFLAEPLVEDPAERHLAAVRRAIDYVYAGDIFQANLARAWTGRLRPGVSHADLFEQLRRANPGPFAGLATWGHHAVISSSPERLVAVREGHIETRPIAGTRPRGATVPGDAALSAELLAHPKERAEHIMLVDLERNDLSRVAIPGSVRVSEYMVLESYAHVHHIVSNVTGRLHPGATPGRIVAAVFPGGTITGCPKVRCMEIIGELEGTGRGFYTGAMGYLNRDGSLDLNILIRTMIREEDRISFRAGGGIVADSIPERELDETRAKALGLVRALEGNGA